MQLRDFNSKEAVQRALDEGDEELASEIDDIIKSWIAIGNRRRQHAEYEDEAAQWAQTARDFKAEEIVQAIISHFNTVGIPEEILLRYVKDKDNWSDTRGRHTFTSRNERGVSSAAFTEVASVETQLWFPLDVPDDAGVENIPDSFIQDALSEIGADAWSEPVPQIVGQEAIFGYLEGDPIDIMAENFRLEEALVDMRQEYATEHVENETDEVFDQVMTEIAATGQQLGRIEGRQEEFTLNQAKELVRRAREMWKGLERQPPLYAPPEEEITDSIKIALAQWIKGDQKAALLGLREVCDYFPEADHDLEVVGVIEFKGEKGETPWTVYNLKSQDLWAESAKMNHCVGDPEQKYGRSVKDGDILIWSVRLPSGKPMFTIEIDPNWKNWVDQNLRAFFKVPVDSTPVKQIKGNANREPGFSRARKLDTWMNVKGTKEVKRLAKFFYGLGLDPFLIDDLRPGMQMIAMLGREGQWEGDGTQDYFAPEHREERLRENPVKNKTVMGILCPIESISTFKAIFTSEDCTYFLDYCAAIQAALHGRIDRQRAHVIWAKRRQPYTGHPMTQHVGHLAADITKRKITTRFSYDHEAGWDPIPAYAHTDSLTADNTEEFERDPKNWTLIPPPYKGAPDRFVFVGRVAPWDKDYGDDLTEADQEEMQAMVDEYRDNPDDDELDPELVEYLRSKGITHITRDDLIVLKAGEIAREDQEDARLMLHRRRGLYKGVRRLPVSKADSKPRTADERDIDMPYHPDFGPRRNPLEDWREPLDDLSDEELEQKLITAVLHRAELARVGFPYDGIQAEIRQIRAEMLSRGHMVYPSLSPFENPDEEEKKPTLKCLWVGGPPGQTFLKIKKKLMTIKGDHFTGIEVIKQSWDAAAVSDLRKFDLIIVNQDMVGHPEYLDTKAVAKAQGVPLVMGSLSFTRTYIELQKAGFVR